MIFDIKNAACESGLAKKCVCNEGIEKNVPEHKNSMKRNLSYKNNSLHAIKMYEKTCEMKVNDIRT